jgi:hypothetical protein
MEKLVCPNSDTICIYPGYCHVLPPSQHSEQAEATNMHPSTPLFTMTTKEVIEAISHQCAERRVAALQNLTGPNVPAVVREFAQTRVDLIIANLPFFREEVDEY